MMSTKIDGKQIAAEIKTNLAERVNKLKAQGIQPGLGTLLVGEDPGSMKYVAGKHADCQEVGITSVKKELRTPASTTSPLPYANSTKIRPAPGSSSSCRCPRASTRTRSST